MLLAGDSYRANSFDRTIDSSRKKQNKNPIELTLWRAGGTVVVHMSLTTVTRV